MCGASVAALWLACDTTALQANLNTTALTHIAIQESLNGKVVDRLERVSNEQYQG